MKLRELRNQVEKGYKPILEVINPDGVLFVLLQKNQDDNPYNYRESYSLYRYVYKWIVWQGLCELKDFEHIGEALDIISANFKVFISQKEVEA